MNSAISFEAAGALEKKSKFGNQKNLSLRFERGVEHLEAFVISSPESISEVRRVFWVIRYRK